LTSTTAGHVQGTHELSPFRVSSGPTAASWDNAFGGVPDFRIEDDLVGEAAAIFAVHGELDLHEAPALKERIAAAIDRGANLIVVDLTEVTFIDSMALGVLLGAINQLRLRGGNLRLVVPNPSIRRIFEISLLDQVFTLDSSRDEAFARPSGPAPADVG
jgi:anti-sigma B factor antagonist